MRKIVVIFYATGNQKIRPSGKIKESILHEETSGYQSVAYFFAFCVWMLFSAVTVNLNKIGFNFTTDQLFFINRITLRFWRIIACSLLLYGAYIRWTPMDGF